jgi:hypothetical protein
MKKRWLLAVFVLTVLSGGILFSDFCVGSAQACGGLFTREQFIEQNAERMIFTVNGDGTITTTVGIHYTGEAEEFSWILPVPSEPELDVAETATLDALELATNVEVFAPTFECGTRTPSPGLGGGSGPVVGEGQVGPFDFTILSSEDPSAVTVWLEENGYQVTDNMLPIIADYVDAGMFFVAMKLTAGAGVEDIQPIQMTYEAEQPMIPLRIAAGASADNLPVLVWIFADTAYAPQNYADVRVDFSQFRDARGMRDTGTYFNMTTDANDQYDTLRDNIQDAYDGRAFITEYAQPSQNLLGELPYDMTPLRFVQQGREEIASDPYLKEVIASYPYVTRLRAQISPHQMTQDPVFAPVAAPLPDVDNIVFLGDEVDPIDYYQCSSRLLSSVEQLDDLPDGFLRVDEWRFAVRYPEPWQLSTFEVENLDYSVLNEDYNLYAYSNASPLPAPVTVNALAREPVTAETLAAFIAGEATPPMFVFAQTSMWFESFDGIRDEVDLTPAVMVTLGLAPETILPQAGRRTVADVRFDSFWNPTMGGDNDNNVVYAMLASEQDWRAQGDVFDAMVEYAASYQFFADDELQHSLFLPNTIDRAPDGAMSIPYAAGWYSMTTLDGDVIISNVPLERDADLSNIPFVRYKSMQTLLLEADWWLQGLWADGLEWMEAQYGVEIDFELNLENGEISCLTEDTITVEFEHEGRTGMARMTPNYIIEYSAPTDLLETYETELVMMWEHGVDVFTGDIWNVSIEETSTCTE